VGETRNDGLRGFIGLRRVRSMGEDRKEKGFGEGGDQGNKKRWNTRRGDGGGG